MSPRSFRARRASALVGVVMAVVAVLGGCSNGGEPAADDGTTTSAPDAHPAFLDADVQVRAEDINFTQTRFRAGAGEVTIGYVNEGRILHTLVLESGGERVDDFARLAVDKQGDVAIGSVSLAPGEYVLYCDVAGHRSSGMEATLIVENGDER